MYKYVIVEDIDVIRQGIELRMKNISYPFQLVGTAEDGRQGYDLICREIPDLAIIDMRMPDIDGVELMHMLRQAKNDVKIIIVSGYSDFKYAQAGIQAGAVAYLLKPFTEQDLKEALDSALNALTTQKNNNLREREMRRLTSYLSTPAAKADTPFETLAIDSIRSVFVLSDIQTKSHPVGSLKKCRFDLVVPFSPPSSKDVLYVIGCAHEDANFDLQKEMRRLISPFAGIAGISSAVTGVDRLHEASRQARQARLLATKNGKSQYVWKENHACEQGFPRDLSTQLHYFIEKQERILFIENMTKYFFECAEKNCSYLQFVEQLRHFFESSIDIYRYDAYQQSIDIPTNDGFDNILYAPNTNDQIIEHLTGYLFDFFSSITRYRTTADPILIAKQYIDKHFIDDLSLDILADVTNTSVSYLSHHFKQVVGSGFLEYRNALRLDYARKMLAQTNKTIRQIARYTGFNNEKYFHRVFKQKFGISPAGYRKQAESAAT